MITRVSIVTVCLNAAGTIRAALESARAQTYRPIEHVIVDGGSTDGTLDAIAEVAESIGCLVCEPDAGIYDAMNKGVARATGEVVYFLNADDRFADRTVVADVVPLFEREALDLVYGNVRCIDEGRRYLKTHRRIDRNNLRFERICHQAVFARRSLFERFAGFDTDYRICADHEWLLRVFHAGAVVRHVERTIAEFRLGGAHARAREIDRRETRALRARYGRGVLDDLYGLAYRAFRKCHRASGHGHDA